MKDPRNLKDYENLKEILGEELGQSLYDHVNYYYDKLLSDLALQQFIGYVKGGKSCDLNYFISSMGLTKNEWNKIKWETVFDYDGLRFDIEKYFLDNNEL